MRGVRVAPPPIGKYFVVRTRPPSRAAVKRRRKLIAEAMFPELARPPVPRLALTQREAAEALGVGLTTFKTKLAPRVRVVREGSIRLYSLRELERWLDEKAEGVLDG
jgi:hypothetical protein